MQAALPLGPPVALNTYGVTAALLVGIAVFPGQQALAEAIPYKSVDTVKAVTTSEFLTKESSLGPNNNPIYGQEQVSRSLGKLESDKESIQEQLEKHGKKSTGAPVEESARESLAKPAKESNEINNPVKDITLRQELIEYARTWIGVPYLWGGESRTGIDCSALVQKVYANYGISLRRTSHEQFRQGEGVALTNLLPGDLVFFSTNGPGASHVGIYLGNREFLSATRRQVEIQALDSPYWQKAYRGSRRILP